MSSGLARNLTLELELMLSASDKWGREQGWAVPPITLGASDCFQKSRKQSLRIQSCGYGRRRKPESILHLIHVSFSQPQIINSQLARLQAPIR